MSHAGRRNRLLSIPSAAWEVSERIRRAKEQPPLPPMMTDPALAHLSLAVYAEPPTEFMGGFIVQPFASE